MKLKFSPLKHIFIYLFPFTLLISYLANKNASVTEKIYSQGLYVFIGKGLSLLTMPFSISMAEIIVGVAILWMLWKGIQFFYIAFQVKKHKKNILWKKVIMLLNYMAILYFLFIFLWGLNYHRLPFSHIANLSPQPVSTEVLAAMCEDLIAKTNNLRETVTEDKDGVTHIPQGFKSISQRAYSGFKVASNKYPELEGQLSQPKAVCFSKALSYAGISGIYFPFTGEANINILIPDAMLPSTTCHEMAHQRGFAREDEANYIAYIVCNMHPDYDFQYSGNLLALIHSMNTLYKYDVNRYDQLIKEYSPGLKRDIIAINDFWDAYEGPIERASSKMNNAYLKSNLQEEGTKSYGRMVDLLIAEYLNRLSNENSKV